MTMLVGPAALVLTAVCLLLLPRRRPTPPGASVLEAVLRRWRRSALVVGAGLPLMGLVPLAAALDGALPSGIRLFLVSMGAALFAFGLFVAVSARRRLTALQRALVDAPEVIAAVDPRAPLIALTLAAGERLAFTVHPADYDRAVEELARRAPHSVRRS